MPAPVNTLPSLKMFGPPERRMVPVCASIVPLLTKLGPLTTVAPVPPLLRKMPLLMKVAPPPG